MTPERGDVATKGDRPTGEAKSRGDLEWSRLVDAVRARCRGPLRERLRELPLAATCTEARLALAEAAEAAKLSALADPLPLDGVREVTHSLDRLERSGAIDGPELRAVASTLGAARALRRYLRRRRQEAPSLYEACSTDPTLDELQEELQRAIEPDGRLADSASAELGKLRAEVSALRGRIVSKLEHLLLAHADIVQDRFHTLREGRYVIPIRTDAHEKLPGIVHGTSSSGASIFVEPRAIVAQGNRLKMAQGDLEREEARILSLLSGRVADRLAGVRAAVVALDRADLRAASARLAEDIEGSFPTLESTPLIELRGARHPLLVLDGVDVVANDLSVASGHALVFSGPNAGGKTVALKVLGLAALMVRAGLPLPAREGSRAGFFRLVLTDVGDEQSIERNLSTFSAHVSNLGRVLETADAGALVVLDEVATGTDPEEGAVLAVAVVEALLEAGAAVAVTTHYERLKALAITDERLRNASVGFDVEAMEPTFEVRLDVPGSSSALSVARRFGMPESVVARARGLLPEPSRAFDLLTRRLEERFEALDEERRSLSTARREAEDAKARADRARDKLRARDAKKLSEEAEKVMAKLREARAELKAARAALRAERRTEASVADAKRRIESAACVARDAAPAPTASVEEKGHRLAPDAIRVGDRVWVPHLRAEVDVVEAPSRGRLRVAAGPVKLWVKIEEVRSLEAPKEAASSGSESGPTSAEEASRERARPPSSANTIDVRGMRVDDALSMTESFLDRMFGRSEVVAYVKHGTGSGALREAIREHLTKHAGQYVRRLRPGELEEGGETITAVYLR